MDFFRGFENQRVAENNQNNGNGERVIKQEPNDGVEGILVDPVPQFGAGQQMAPVRQLHDGDIDAPESWWLEKVTMRREMNELREQLNEKDRLLRDALEARRVLETGEVFVSQERQIHSLNERLYLLRIQLDDEQGESSLLRQRMLKMKDEHKKINEMKDARIKELADQSRQRYYETGQLGNVPGPSYADVVHGPNIPKNLPSASTLFQSTSSQQTKNRPGPRHASVVQSLMPPKVFPSTSTLFQSTSSQPTTSTNFALPYLFFSNFVQPSSSELMSHSLGPLSASASVPAHVPAIPVPAPASSSSQMPPPQQPNLTEEQKEMVEEAMKNMEEMTDLYKYESLVKKCLFHPSKKGFPQLSHGLPRCQTVFRAMFGYIDLDEASSEKWQMADDLTAKIAAERMKQLEKNWVQRRGKPDEGQLTSSGVKKNINLPMPQ